MTALALVWLLLAGRVDVAVAAVYATPGDRFDDGRLACPAATDEQARMGFASRDHECGDLAVICGPKACAVGVKVDTGPYGALTKKGWRVRKRLRPGESYRGSLDLRPALAKAVGVRGVEAVAVMWLDKE